MWRWYSAATTFSCADFYSQINLNEEQYTATGPNKRKSSALDLIIFFLCSKTEKQKRPLAVLLVRQTVFGPHIFSMRSNNGILSHPVTWLMIRSLSND